MQSFDVLNSQTLIHQHCVLQASAGTGKTFAIENIVARLLIESVLNQLQKINLDQILIVTFTRASTKDLKERIRQTLYNLLKALDRVETLTKFPYLNVKSDTDKDAIKKIIQQSLYQFETAQIFTIHSFCTKALRDHTFHSDIHIDALDSFGRIDSQELFCLIKDYFRMENNSQRISPVQLALLLKKFNNQFEDFENALFQLLSKGVKIQAVKPFSQLFEQFSRAMTHLKEEERFESKLLQEDIDVLLLCYKKPVKYETLVEPHLQFFINLFNKSSWTVQDFERLLLEGLVILKIFDSKQLKVKAKLPSNLHYPQLILQIKHHLQNCLDVARDEAMIMALVAKDCQDFVDSYLEAEEKFRFDDLLKKTLIACEDRQFAQKMRTQYRAVIIDEFQDTDPVQWKIFSRLFLKDSSWQGCFYIVGDPKQAIYRFRQADIYTYLEAVETIGAQRVYSLDTNYRSLPQMIDGLNQLFQMPQHSLFHLPIKQKWLDYPLVKSPASSQLNAIEDQKQSIHFMSVSLHEKEKRIKLFSTEEIEKQYFFPFIAEEILSLKDRVSLKEIAILVKDRFQARRLADFLKTYHIPYEMQNHSCMTDSKMFLALRELLEAVIYPGQISILKVALGGAFIQWNAVDIEALSQLKTRLEIQKKFFLFHEILKDKGLIGFFEAFLKSQWHSHQKSVLEMLLELQEGQQLYFECRQLIEMLIEDYLLEGLSLKDYLKFFQKLEEFGDREETAKAFVNSAQEAVKIMTMHASKGLEFDVVFPIGIICRQRLNLDFITVNDQEEQYLAPLLTVEKTQQTLDLQEIDAEKMRLFYVALTRAKKRIYIPLIFTNPFPALNLGEASPLELFLALKTGQNIYDASSLALSFSQFFQTIQTDKELFSHTDLTVHAFKQSYFSTSNQVTLIKPSTIKISNQPLMIQSFTSLVQSKANYIEQKLNTFPPVDINHEIKTVHTLPVGAKTGVFIHNLLQSLPLYELQTASSSQQLESYLALQIKNTPYATWCPVIAEMIYAAFHTKLNCQHSQFTLAEVNPAFMYREMEFMFPVEHHYSWPEERIILQEGILKGIIDCVFLYDGNYYLIDWKTNWLGCQFQDYGVDHLKNLMREQQYFLQAKIYIEALRRYVNLVDSRPFEECFGGVTYLFLRGIDPITSQLASYIFTPSFDLFNQPAPLVAIR